jgi:hypothetical protein
MQCETTSRIIAAEERLRAAMLASDAAALDELISPALMFTNHLGQVFGKQDDIALHRSGVLRFLRMDPSESQLKIYAKLCIVSVRIAVAGTFGGAAFEADLRYTRVWHLSEKGHRQIVAGHSSAVMA